ncbi:SIR2 family protein [Ruegeria sp. HKCCD4884]|uniref:SIR2 family protein n=1 Tax=Ruegeria sp. HKCCD4884 TaxID=2683022 RepID=UPI001491023B|nr:SIR2 family protein [Ruegeria sp. HKCCD4884]NOD95485.1 SIR2 family protein [Ruegeria sp. HKCCD4884]
MSYEDYKAVITEDVAQQISTLRCQPVLFFGSGMSRRYLDAPTWSGLLERIADDCPLIDRAYAYYAQSCTAEPQIGSLFAEKYRDWAWDTGSNKFPDTLFDATVSPDAFLKYAVSEVIREYSDVEIDGFNPPIADEINALKEIKPHAILTTNYDTFLEKVFPDYKVIVGQTALKGMPLAIGEIFKIHGCIEDISQIVITSEDYETFGRKKKFIAARLLSLFNEHPLLIAGYSASDPNVRALLSDIDEALALPGSLIENIYFVEYDPDAVTKSSLPTEKLIQIEEKRSVRVKLIVTSDFQWVFEAFKSPDTINAVPASMMRAILARSYELVRTDAPRNTLEVDYDFLERKLDNPTEFAKLFGITTVSDASILSAKYRFSSTELGKALGGKSWHIAVKLIDQVKAETGFDMKAGDNKYHRQQRVNTSMFHQYSDEAYDLLKRVQDSGYCDPEWLK